MTRLLVVGILGPLALGLPACTAPSGSGPYREHGEPSDLQPAGKADGASAPEFNRHRIMSDSVFTDTETLDGDAVQEFLEDSPYDGRRSWLAGVGLNGRRFSDQLVAVGTQMGINPLVLLARMQVEQSLVSPAERPADDRVRFAFGCGCPDGEECSSMHATLSRQLVCVAETLRRWYNRSKRGSGRWRMGLRETSIDGKSVRPQNHATASLYAYTPWVLIGQGGNWLVWNVTERYRRHFRELGYSFRGGEEQCIRGDHEGFVGDRCECDADCDGYCHSAGFCTTECSGLCPDRPNHVTTFCVERTDTERVQGMCVERAVANNDHCAALPSSERAEVERYVGESGVSKQTKAACLPR